MNTEEEHDNMIENVGRLTFDGENTGEGKYIFKINGKTVKIIE